MKKLLAMLLIGFFFAAVSCGPQTTEQQQESQPEETMEQPQMEDNTLEGDTVEVETDTTVVQ